MPVVGVAVSEKLPLLLVEAATLLDDTADVAEIEAADEAVLDSAGAEDPSHVATLGPGIVYGLPPLSGWPELP